MGLFSTTEGPSWVKQTNLSSSLYLPKFVTGGFMCKLCVKKVFDMHKTGIMRNNLSDVNFIVGMCPAVKALEELTPQGFEVYEDPNYCVKYVKDKIQVLADSIIRVSRARTAAELESHQLKRIVDELRKKLKENDNGLENLSRDGVKTD